MLQGEHVENASNAIPRGFSLGIVLLPYTTVDNASNAIPRGFSLGTRIDAAVASNANTAGIFFRNANRSFHGEHVEKAIAETRAIQSGDFLWERESIVLHGEHVEKAIAETRA